MSHLNPDILKRCEDTLALYPKRRSALIPLCHLAQEQEGYLSEAAMIEIAELVGVTPAEVQGTASFYDMLHLEPVGRYVVGVCTNIACLINGADEMLEHAESALGTHVGGTTSDGLFTLEETECLADCDRAPCVQVNHRFVRTTTPELFDELVDDLRAGRRGDEIPPHGTLVRVQRSGGLRASADEIAGQRSKLRSEIEGRAKR